MAVIRPFLNSDLPGLFEVWIRHWTAARQSPAVSVSILERALLSRSFFDPSLLMVGLADNQVIAWTHSFITDHDDAASTANVAAICFADDPGLAICDQLLKATEQRLFESGVSEIRIGPLRDDRNGYAGLAPIGHGIGVPVGDTRTGSLLSRNGYQVANNLERLVVGTSTYRPPVNRAFLQLRRTTRLDHIAVLPSEDRNASALSHFDIERHILVDHRQQQPLADCGLWMGDPEVQVMESSRAILSLDVLPSHRYDGQPMPATSPTHAMSDEQEYLIASMIQSLSNRQIFTVETVVDRNDGKLIEQFKGLKFESVEQGRQWIKSVC